MDHVREPLRRASPLNHCGACTRCTRAHTRTAGIGRSDGQYAWPDRGRARGSSLVGARRQEHAPSPRTLGLHASEGRTARPARSRSRTREPTRVCASLEASLLHVPPTAHSNCARRTHKRHGRMSAERTWTLKRWRDRAPAAF
eukprot:6199728-Pleurochrysis_carterae.AAC.3